MDAAEWDVTEVQGPPGYSYLMGNKVTDEDMDFCIK